MSTYLLETTICSHLMKENLIVKERLDKLTALDAYFTIPIVQGEILYGIELLEIGRRQRYLSQRANSLFEGIECNPLPKGTGIYYAQLRRQAEQQGTRLHDNDLWIAAAALTFDAILVTSDRDFYRVQGLLGLQLENWLMAEDTSE